jgi:hypothetical protein
LAIVDSLNYKANRFCFAKHQFFGGRFGPYPYVIILMIGHLEVLFASLNWRWIVGALGKLECLMLGATKIFESTY